MDYEKSILNLCIVRSDGGRVSVVFFSLYKTKIALHFLHTKI